MKNFKRISVLIVGLLMFQALIPGNMFQMTGNVEGADPPPPIPTSFFRLTDTNLTDTFVYDRFTWQRWNYTAEVFEPRSVTFIENGVILEDWKQDLIDTMNESTLSGDVVCLRGELPEDEDYWDNWDLECRVRDKAWDVAYPYVVEVYEEIEALIIELLLRYFDPWDPPALTVLVPLILISDSISFEVLNATHGVTWTHTGKEPIVFRNIIRIYRNFLRNLAVRCELDRYSALNEGRMMIRGISLMNNTVYNLVAIPDNTTWAEYVVNVNTQVNASIENISDAQNYFDFQVWIDETDKLQLSLELFRDGIVEWGLGLHLNDNLDWLYQGTLIGYVYDQDTGRAITGVNIQARSLEGEHVGFTATDSAGSFRLKLPRGQYNIIFTKSGYISIEEKTEVHAFQESELNAGIPETQAEENFIASLAQSLGVVFIALAIIGGVWMFARWKWKPANQPAKTPKPGKKGV